jgi:hypothetical protein
VTTTDTTDSFTLGDMDKIGKKEGAL